jgi:hypothetical protein
MYEMEGNMKECKFTNKVEAEMKSPEGTGHCFPETADHDVTQNKNDESVWTMRRFVAFVNRNRELYDEMLEEEVNSLVISVKKDGKGNASCMKKV